MFHLLDAAILEEELVLFLARLMYLHLLALFLSQQCSSYNAFPQAVLLTVLLFALFQSIDFQSVFHFMAYIVTVSRAMACNLRC